MMPHSGHAAISASAHPGLGEHWSSADFAGAPDVVYLESTGEGHIVDSSDEVRTIVNAYETIRARALSARASIDPITKVMEQWT